MNKVCIDRIEELVEDIQTFKKHLKRVNTEGILVLEEGDKKEIDAYNFSEEVKEVNEVLEELLNAIADKMDEIYTNAVNDRESYPENSMVKRALWLDDIENKVSYISRLTES